ncbi:hypothetical protein ACWZJV_08555 [Nocardioides sp. WG-D5]|uniref:hypothetical protein n=1 Tax=Nocardioides luteus TaxID=1844 RepID=UPI0002028145|nr:hypothetical protein [Nocardioides luteus]EGD40121.1 putative integral membrane protein [Nocardioidaceae bacterium Broad-1]MBG6094895.1 putative membrane protein YeaQ/YmgE (transglycosylase-associated protein family) [Nocardioides luteus]
MIGTILVTLIGGVVIGLLGKWLAPGDKDNIPLWLTVVCGIVGMIVGSLLYWVIFGQNNPAFDGHEAAWDNATNGVDWWRHIWQVVVAAVAVVVASGITGRSKA